MTAVLSAIAGVSREHLSRVFRSCLDTTPSDYITRRRLERAAGLLRGTNYKVMDIALETGFESPEHFSRLFRGAYGISPRKYRKELTLGR